MIWRDLIVFPAPMFMIGTMETLRVTGDPATDVTLALAGLLPKNGIPRPESEDGKPKLLATFDDVTAADEAKGIYERLLQKYRLTRVWMIRVEPLTTYGPEHGIYLVSLATAPADFSGGKKALTFS